ncbi:MAG: hypothetical protein LBS28_04560 [Streptococcaceae bacterium]|jgi:hypothetical protein|nr:hypothetical protein [Streptococcaceae bacterium]
MRKIVSLCLLFFVFCSALLIINVYQIKDEIRLRSIEMIPNSSFHFYIKQSSQRTISEELTFLAELSKEEKISIFKTDYLNDKDETIVKSVVFDRESFPFQQFSLQNKNLFKNNKNTYASFDMKSKHQVGKLLTFVKKNKIFLQSLENYYLDSSKSLNGIYSVVSTKNLNKERIVNKLSAFFQVDRKELLTNPTSGTLGLINRYTMLFALIIILSFLVLIIVTVYAPLMEIKSIGVKKLNGISDFTIFGDFIKKNVTLLIGTCFLTNAGIILYFNYLPEGFLRTLFLAQILIFMIFFMANSFTYLIIKKVTISQMLKQFLDFKYGNISCFVVKFLLALLSTLLLFQISTLFDDLFKQYQLNKAWQNNGKLLTVEFVHLSEEDNQNFLLNNFEYEKKFTRFFENLEKETKAMYIHSRVIDPDKNLVVEGNNQKKNIFNSEEKYEVMTINNHFLKTLPIKYQSAKDDIREFFIPNSFQKNEVKMKYLCQHLLFSSLNSQEREGKVIEELPVRLIYYNDNHFSIFSYNSENKNFLKKPIFMLFNANNMTFNEQTSCNTTGENCPIKITNSKKNREKIKKLMKKNNINVKFSTVNSIIGSYITSYKMTIFLFSVILLFVFLLDIFALIFLLICIIQSKKKKLSVERLLGVKILNRYKIEFSLIFGFYSIQILTICLFCKSMFVMPMALIIILFEAIIIFLTIIRKEKKNLVSLLKGE